MTTTSLAQRQNMELAASQQHIDLLHVGAWAYNNDRKDKKTPSTGPQMPQSQKVAEKQTQCHSIIERWQAQNVHEGPWNHLGATNFVANREDAAAATPRTGTANGGPGQTPQAN